MLPSKYIISDCDRSSKARSHVSASMDPYHPHLPPPLGITGVICTSRMIDLPKQRGKLHCTIYRPRMLEPLPTPQQPPISMSTTGTSSSAARRSNPPKLHNNMVPNLPKPNPPLICVAGGPGMSCQYLTGLVHLIPDRAVILYDHYNCGQSTNSAVVSGSNSSSSRYTTVTVQGDTAVGAARTNAMDDNILASENDDGKSCSFLHDTVEDLATLIETILPIKSSFHLFGHSMGGIIAYEYLKKMASSQQKNINLVEQSDEIPANIAFTSRDGRICKSCILASTPTNIAASYQSKKELISSIIEELNETGYERISKKPSRIDDGDDDGDDDDDEAYNDSDVGDAQQQQLRQAAHLVFQQRHECRTVPLPLSLQQSLTGLNNSNRNMSRLGTNQQKTNRRRTTNEIHPASFNEYMATPPRLTPPMEIQLPPALVIRGQYDFVSETNCRYWEDVYQMCGSGNICRYITISNCSHYGFLEQETLYGNVVLSFLHDHDGKDQSERRVDNV